MNRNLTFPAFVLMLLVVIVLVIGEPGREANAQTAAPTLTPTVTATPYPLPLPNALIIYDQTTATLINVADAPISVAGVSFMRAGDVVRLDVGAFGITTLGARHCIEWWTASVTNLPNKPGECAVRDRWARLTKDNQYFWVGGIPNEPFRPELNTSALTICNTSAGRCLIHIMQGDE